MTSYPQAALGYDEGTVVIKLGSEARCYAIYAAKPSTCPCSRRPTAVSQEPVVSMHSGKIIWVDPAWFGSSFCLLVGASSPGQRQ